MARTTTRFRTTKATIDKVTDILRKALEDRSEDEFVFAPITIEPRFDHEGDEYLKIYVVFEGDLQRLDPAWTIGLRSIILDQTKEDEVFRVPSISFVEKEEWEEALGGDPKGYKKLA